MIKFTAACKSFAANRTKMKHFLLPVLALLFVNLLQAQDTTKSAELKEVVVTGQYRPQSVKNSVYQVKVITRERIEKQGAAKLQDILNSELNMRFTQDPATGGSDITMMGMKGQNVKILLDGMPLIGRQGTSNEININQIDINSIERIEIVEGPMSVIYGADALAGVINIITKKATAARLNVTARLHEETIGNEYGVKQGIHNQSAGFNYRYKNWELGGGFSHNYFGGWKDTAVGRELIWHKKDQRLANGYVGYQTARFNVRYRIDGLDEVITNPGNFEAVPQPGALDRFAADQEYLSQRVMHQLQAGAFFNSRLSAQLQTAYSDYSRQVYSTLLGYNSGKRVLNTASGAQSVVDFTGFSLRGTVLYKVSDKVSLQPGVDMNLESGEGERLHSGNNKVNDYAFFVTSEITPSAGVSIRPGLRFIHNSVYDAPPVIPSINTKFILAKNLDFRASYARGFRSPSLRELYFNFFDANHQIIGNPNLKAETSNSFNGSFTWKKITPQQVVYSTVLGGFYNSVKNLIDYAVSANNPNIFELTNVSNSRTAGVTLTSVAKYQRWNVSAGFSYTGFYNDYSETDKELPQLQWSPEATTNLGYVFPKIGLDVNLFYKFTGKRPRYVVSGSDIVLSKVDSYSWADFTVNKKLFRYFTLSAGIRNLFDVDRVNSSVSTGGIHTAGAQNIGYGRSYFAGLVFNWAKQ
jgi:outer membrane receptor for ferrienterochelin and colicins